MEATWPRASSASWARWAAVRTVSMLSDAEVRKSVLWPISVGSLSRRYWKPQKSATLPGGKNESELRLPVRNPRASKAMVVDWALSETACSIVYWGPPPVAGLPCPLAPCGGCGPPGAGDAGPAAAAAAGAVSTAVDPSDSWGAVVVPWTVAPGVALRQAPAKVLAKTSRAR